MRRLTARQHQSFLRLKTVSQMSEIAKTLAEMRFELKNLHEAKEDLLKDPKASLIEIHRAIQSIDQKRTLIEKSLLVIRHSLIQYQDELEYD